VAFFGGAALLGLGLLSALPRQAAAWGPVASQVVVSRAIETLPKGLKPFYKQHRFEIPSLALEPTFPEDSPERRFAIDRLLSWPFADVPRSEKEMKQRYPAEAATVGRLPWLIEESHARLVEAFKSGDKVKILNESDTLALLVAEVHNPLALTENADGQKTGQHGLWLRFSVKFPEAVKDRLKVDPDAARYLDDPEERLRGDLLRELRAAGGTLSGRPPLARRGGRGQLLVHGLDGRGPPRAQVIS
jgi:hypothetical protein